MSSLYKHLVWYRDSTVFYMHHAKPFHDDLTSRGVDHALPAGHRCGEPTDAYTQTLGDAAISDDPTPSTPRATHSTPQFA